MNRFNRIFFGFFMGFIFPVCISLLFIGIWFYTDKNEAHAPIYATIGFSSGLLVDLLFLKHWVNRLYVLPTWFVAGIYLLYTICVYGFFMGFPVFNTFLGLLVGYYYGNRICSNNVIHKIQPKLITNVSLFTGLVMTLICISTGIIALTDKTIGENIQIMLGLNFEVTKLMILFITFFSGFSLIIFQYFITKIAITKTIGIINLRK